MPKKKNRKAQQAPLHVQSCGTRCVSPQSEPMGLVKGEFNWFINFTILNLSSFKTVLIQKQHLTGSR